MGRRAFLAAWNSGDKPAKWDGQPYFMPKPSGSGFEIKEETDSRCSCTAGRDTKYRRSVGYGVICIEDMHSTVTYWRTFSPGTTENRARRLWAAHTDERTHYGRSLHDADGGRETALF